MRRGWSFLEGVTSRLIVRLLDVAAAGIVEGAAGWWAGFWTPRRQRAYPAILLILAIFWCAAGLIYLWAAEARDGEQYGSDFVVYYAAGELALNGDAKGAYDLRTIHKAEQDAVGKVEPFPYYYPPPYQLVLAPLAAAPYPAALAAWAGLGLALAALVLRRIVWPWSIGVGLAWFVPAFAGIAFGQNGMFTAALLGGGLLFVDRRPGLAGMLLGALTYKPQFLLVAGVGLVFGRRWTVLGWAAATAGVLALLSLAVFGPGAWRAFFDSLSAASDSLYQREGSEKMPGVLAAGVTLGLPKLVSQALHMVVAIPCLLAAASMWRGKVSAARRNAATVLATVVVSPYAFVYDLPVLLLVVGWMAMEARARGGWLPWERLVLGLAVTAPVWAWLLAEATSVQLGWAVLAALLGVVVANGRGRPVRMS